MKITKEQRTSINNNSIGQLNSRVDTPLEKIGGLEYRSEENTQNKSRERKKKQNTKEKLKSPERQREWNIHLIRVPQREERQYSKG